MLYSRARRKPATVGHTRSGLETRPEIMGAYETGRASGATGYLPIEERWPLFALLRGVVERRYDPAEAAVVIGK